MGTAPVQCQTLISDIAVPPRPAVNATIEQFIRTVSYILLWMMVFELLARKKDSNPSKAAIQLVENNLFF